MAHSPDELLSALIELGLGTKTVDHDAVFTVEQSRNLRGTVSGTHTKNLFLRDNKKTFFLVTVDENRKVDLKQLRSMIGAKGGLSFASPDALLEHLGVLPGSVSPFAAFNDVAKAVKVFLDEELLQASLVNCHPLVNTKTTSIAPGDLVAFLRWTGHEPQPLSFAEEPEGDGQALA